MCLAVPAKIIALTHTSARARISGIEREVDTRLVPGVKPGDYVLVHAGFAIEKIRAEDAGKLSKLLGKLK